MSTGRDSGREEVAKKRAQILLAWSGLESYEENCYKNLSEQ